MVRITAGRSGTASTLRRMRAMREGAAPPAAWADVAKPAPAATESKGGPGRNSQGADATEESRAPVTGKVVVLAFGPGPR